jgi:hypothetical protein
MQHPSVHAAFPGCSGATRMVERSRSMRLLPHCWPQCCRTRDMIDVIDAALRAFVTRDMWGRQ